jgi:hypothetical protein
MTLAFHVCRNEATDVAATNYGVGGHLASIESTHFYNSLPPNRESVDTVSMIRESFADAPSKINPSRADSQNSSEELPYGD